MFLIRQMFAGFLVLALLQGCDIIFPPTKLTEIATFDSDLPPDSGNQRNRAIELINHATVEMAKASGQPRALQIGDGKPAPNQSWPADRDLMLRAFFSRESLAASSVVGLLHGKRSAIPETALNSIDFSKQFAVVLSRPKQALNLPSTSDLYTNDTSALYIDSLLREHSFENAIVLRLQSSVLGQPSLFQREWTSKIFVLDRDDATALKFLVGKNEYIHPLKGSN